MLIKTKDFQEAASKILIAVDLDKNVANLELVATADTLYMNVTNKEYFVSVKFNVENATAFRAVVDAHLFLSLIAGFTDDAFELSVYGPTVLISGVDGSKLNYKLAMIYEKGALANLPRIELPTVDTEMDIDTGILTSILTVNRKELQKAKRLTVKELQRLYYIDETGCFTFTSGACLNAFDLAKPVKLLLNDRIVSLFKLFKSDSVKFRMCDDVLSDGMPVSKVAFISDNVYLAAYVTCDPILLNAVQGPCNASKAMIASDYPYTFSISAGKLLSAISRLMTFTKNSSIDANMCEVKATMEVKQNQITFTDTSGNVECVNFEDGCTLTNSYSGKINLTDFKFVLEPCKNEIITMKCGYRNSLIFKHGTITNLISEVD